MTNEKTLEDIIENSSKHPIDSLRKAIVTYDKNLAVESVKKIIADKEIDILEALDAITGTLRVVGDAFENDELYLPDLLSAADVMNSVMPILEEEIKKSGKDREISGKIVLGTVKGDIHSIGKTMVGSLLSADGFKVYDIGIDVSYEKFINAIQEYNPDVLAMSALLTTTAYEQKNVIDFLIKEGLRDKVKVIVGGAAVTREFADSIGADGYNPSASGAVKLVRKLLNK
jgi:5-methyltetrahydrofolate--homocysteine methyltransferase